MNEICKLFANLKVLPLLIYFRVSLPFIFPTKREIKGWLVANRGLLLTYFVFIILQVTYFFNQSLLGKIESQRVVETSKSHFIFNNNLFCVY